MAITTPLAPIFPEHRRQGRDWRQVAKLWMTDVPLVLERSTGREGRTWELPLLVPAHTPTLALAPHLGWRAVSSPCQNWAASSLVSRSQGSTEAMGFRQEQRLQWLLFLQGFPGLLCVHPSCPMMDSCWVHLLMARWAGEHPVYIEQLGFKFNPLSCSSK